MRRVPSLLGGVLSLGLAVGCGGTPKVPEVRDEWVARVPQEQMGPIVEVRTGLRQTNDEAMRAEVALQDAKRQVEVERSGHEASGARVDAAKKALEAMQQTGDAARIEEARQGVRQAEAARELAGARIALAEARVAAAETRREIAQARLAQGQASVERAEYLALSAIGDTRVRDMRTTQFDEAVTRLGERERELQQKLAQREGEAAARQQQVQQLESQLGAAPAGTSVR